MNYAETLGVKAKAVESAIATAAPQVKNNALAAIADALLARQEEILAANAKDLEAAVQNHMTESLQDRLRLTPARISGMGKCCPPADRRRRSHWFCRQRLCPPQRLADPQNPCAAGCHRHYL